MYIIFTSKYFILNLKENENIEFFWIILPRFILLFIAGPSLKLLYIIEEFIYSSLNLKAVGFQWYWRYQFITKNFKRKEIYLFIEKSNIFRLIETSNYLILPINLPILLLTTSNDVIHSWTVPSLNVKRDSIPGRINQATLLLNQVTILIGQCSEICGANHSFIPINIRSIKL